MASFRLTIALGNDAMQTPGDIAEALRHVAGRVEGYASMRPGESLPLFDENGNRVGEWKVTR